MEVYSLLGSEEEVVEYCNFTTKRDLDAFLRANGLMRYMQARTVKKHTDRGYTTYTYSCPLPLGNAFLLQYNHWKNGECMASQ